MQIAGLSQGYADPGSLGRKPNSLISGAIGAEAERATAPRAPGAMTDILARVVSDYDLQEITPRGFSEMLRELRDAGVLSEGEYADLAQIRLDMDAENLDADEEIDLLDFYQKVADRSRPDGEPSGEQALSIEAVQRRLDWLQKVAILQESPDAAGLNELV